MSGSKIAWSVLRLATGLRVRYSNPSRVIDLFPISFWIGGEAHPFSCIMGARVLHQGWHSMNRAPTSSAEV